jgi:two-component system response regulator
MLNLAFEQAKEKESMKSVEVLMIEDNPGDVVLLEVAVAKVGVDYQITVLADGEAAMRYLRGEDASACAHRPDLIVLDLKLPRKSGRDVLKEIRPDPQLDRVPIVVMSSSRSEMDLTRAMDLPNLAYMAKPSTFRGYVEMIQSIEEFRRETQRQQFRGRQLSK